MAASWASRPRPLSPWRSVETRTRPISLGWLCGFCGRGLLRSHRIRHHDRSVVVSYTSSAGKGPATRPAPIRVGDRRRAAPPAGVSQRAWTPCSRIPTGLFPEEFGVTARTAEGEIAALFFVDQEPIGCDVAVPPALPIAGEGVIPVPRFQRPTRASHLDHRAEFPQILASLLEAFDVFLERRSSEGRQGWPRRRFGAFRLRLGHVRSPGLRTGPPRCRNGSRPGRHRCRGVPLPWWRWGCEPRKAGPCARPPGCRTGG